MTNKERNLQSYLLEITNTNRTLASYVDWEKVKSNSKIHKANLSQLNMFTDARAESDVKEYIDTIFDLGREDVFKSLEILIAKRDDGNEYLDEETFKTVEYDLLNRDSVYKFIIETNLLELFNSVKSLDDYVFGVEVGLDTNGRKNRAGKTMELLISRILRDSGVEYKEQINLSEIDGIESSSKRIKVVDFVFEKDGYTYLIESSFYNAGGSKISEVCNSYADFTAKLDHSKFKMIWVADGKGMKTIRKLLDEQWDNLEVMNIKQFEEMLKK